MSARPRLSVVIVAHQSLRDLRRSLPALRAELVPGDELIVVDSGSSDGLDAELAALDPAAKLIGAGGNVGFAAGANLGAAAATGDLLVLLNPDAVVQPGWRAAIAAPFGGGYGAWMGLVTMAAGTEINTSGGVLHFTGLGWAGQAHQPVAAAPVAPAEVGFLSGACLAIPAARWSELGGFPEEFFMYCEDVDLSLRLRLGGARLAVIPDAVVDHSYDFDKGAAKWRLLERNRWATVIRTYPGALLTLLAPALLVTELAIWLAAALGGWGPMKAAATGDLVRSLPRLLRERREIQASRTVNAAAFASNLRPELDSPYLGPLGRLRPLRVLLRVYWFGVVGLLRIGDTTPLARVTRR